MYLCVPQNRLKLVNIYSGEDGQKCPFTPRRTVCPALLGPAISDSTSHRCHNQLNRVYLLGHDKDCNSGQKQIDSFNFALKSVELVRDKFSKSGTRMRYRNRNRQILQIQFRTFLSATAGVEVDVTSCIDKLLFS